jgi:hypothetical protein
MPTNAATSQRLENNMEPTRSPQSLSVQHDRTKTQTGKF